MHEPIGLSGVHVEANSRQSVGRASPRSTSAQMQALLSAMSVGRKEKRTSASKPAR